MNISLENWLREELDNLERNNEYNVSTDSVRAWIDLYNEFKEKESVVE